MIIIENTHESIIPKETFNRFNEKENVWVSKDLKPIYLQTF